MSISSELGNDDVHDNIGESFMPESTLWPAGVNVLNSLFCGGGGGSDTIVSSVVDDNCCSCRFALFTDDWSFFICDAIFFF